MIEYEKYLAETARVLAKPGAFLVTMNAAKKVNVMAIGWGLVGPVWGRPVFAVMVRPSRYTFRCLEERGEFSVNIPYPEMCETVAYCGTVSGRDRDKIAERKLALVDGRTVAVPSIAGCGLSYECRVIHRNDVAAAALAPEVAKGCYPSGDHHRVYFGEILRVRAEEEFAGRIRR